MKRRKNETLLVQILENVVPVLDQPLVAKKIIIEKIKIQVANLPASFNGFTICHLSDIHNTSIFKNNLELLDQLRKEKIDITIISGDTADNNQFDKALETIDSVNSFCPYSNIYVSIGNHDLVNYKNDKDQDLEKIQNFFAKKGIVFLRNKFKTITKNNDQVSLIGIDDPELQTNEDQFINDELKKITQEIPVNQTKILISHRPEKINLYNKYNIDLVFAGHAHGGQIILPKHRGLIAPNQGMFPKYTSGIYQYGKTQMIVSPGVSNSYIIPRINNPGKIYLVELNST